MSVYNPDDFLFYYSGAERRARVAAEDPSFSRSSTAMRRDRSEIMREVDEGAYRRNWVEDENGFLVPANRLEAARTNSIHHSEDFTQWANQGGHNKPVVTADDAVAPDGTTTADKLEDTDTNDTEGVSDGDGNTVSADSLFRVASMFVKKRSAPAPLCRLALAINVNSLVLYRLSVDPTDGSFDVGAKGATVGAFDGDVVDWNDDWWLLWVAGENINDGSGPVNTVFNPAQLPSGDTPNASGSDASVTGLQHVWGGQMEGVSGGARFPSSYIATAGSAVSRAADDLSFPIGFGPQELTAYGKFVDEGAISGGQGYVFQIGGPLDERFAVLESGSGRMRVFFDNGPSSGQAAVSSGVSYGDVVEYRAVLHGGGSISIEVSVNGGSTVSAGPASIGDLPASWGTSELQVGAQLDNLANTGNESVITGPIIAPGVRTMNECRALAGTA